MSRLAAAAVVRYAGMVLVTAFLAVGCDSIGGTTSGEIELPATTVAPDSEFVGCLECHSDPDQPLPTARPQTLTFNHENHEIASDSVGCGSCHRVESHTETMTIRPTMKGCFECHGVEAADPLPCSSCHPLSVVPRPPSHQIGSWGREHSVTALADDPECATCHVQPQFCDSCHGTEMPHPQGWTEDQHALEFADVGDEVCAMCHGPAAGSEVRSDCDTCHHPDGAPEEPWLVAHSDVVNHQGSEECSTCHVQETFCTACHGVELPHPAGWLSPDHAIASFEDQDDSCVACHGPNELTEPRSECDSCHHPGGNLDQPWILAHPRVVKSEDAQCFSCHAQKTCATCHVDGVSTREFDEARWLDWSDVVSGGG